MTLVCITNKMPDVQACTVKDKHTDICDTDPEHGGHGGLEARLVTRGYEPTGPIRAEKYYKPILQTLPTGRDCRGCQPRDARVGLLCMTCWLRFETALSGWESFAATIRRYDKTVSREGGGSSAEGYVPIPATRLAVNEAYSYLDGTAWTDPQKWVSREPGARNAVLFTRAAEMAYRSHPIEESARKLRRVRCPACNQLSFVRLPPATVAEKDFTPLPVTVKCQNAECGKTITEEPKLVEIAKIERLKLA